MSPEDFASNSFDYVICGGGTAGLVIAARLTEDPNITVGVLEAGENRLNDPLVDGPNTFMQLFGKDEYDWRYKTVAQKGTEGRVHGWIRGKALGGSSAINFNMFSMASRQDLDNWKELGNKGWGFDDLAAYYKKFETYNPPSKILSSKINDKYVDPLLRGNNGPIQVSFCEADFSWIQEAWPDTCINAGYPIPNDPRSGSALGGFNQLTTIDPHNMRRSYSARAYYEPNAHRSNLHVLTGALVEKINLEKTSVSDAKATGVTFLCGGATHTVTVKKEVVVCGGSINSPQILELSGIGSSHVLSRAGIEQIVDNRGVGENLNDHTATGILLGVKDEYPTAEVLVRNPEVAMQAMEAYIKHKAGPFTNAPTTTGFASLQMIDPDLKDAQNHIQSLVSSHTDPSGRDTLLARQLLDPKEAAAQLVCLPSGANMESVEEPEKLFFHDAPGNWMIIGVCSTRSLSRGSVHIESSDPKKQPIIDPAYFSHPLDLDIAARGILHTLNLAQHEPLKSKLRLDENGEFVTHPSAGPPPKTVEEAKKTASKSTVTEYHPIGTCAMLPREKGGAVDNQLKVYGTSNVRVADASIFPTNVQGNIVSLVYAVAEKASDIIKGKLPTA